MQVEPHLSLFKSCLWASEKCGVLFWLKEIFEGACYTPNFENINFRLPGAPGENEGHVGACGIFSGGSCSMVWKMISHLGIWYWNFDG